MHLKYCLPKDSHCVEASVCKNMSVYFLVVLLPEESGQYSAPIYTCVYGNMAISLAYMTDQPIAGEMCWQLKVWMWLMLS